jgi:hypothetical protein
MQVSHGMQVSPSVQVVSRQTLGLATKRLRVVERVAGTVLVVRRLHQTQRAGVALQAALRRPDVDVLLVLYASIIDKPPGGGSTVRSPLRGRVSSTRNWG